MAKGKKVSKAQFLSKPVRIRGQTFWGLPHPTREVEMVLTEDGWLLCTCTWAEKTETIYVPQSNISQLVLG